MPQPTAYLLDTNIILALLRGNALGVALDRDYALSASRTRNLVCVVSVGELLSIGYRAGWGQPKKAALETFLQELIWIDIDDRSILDTYAQIDSFSLSIGKKMGKNDFWIAGSAAVTGATLITTDSDFDHLHGNQIQRIWIDPQTGKTS